LANGLRGGKAEHSFGARVPQADDAFPIAKDNRERSVVDDFAAESVKIEWGGHRWEIIPPTSIDVTGSNVT